MTKEAFVDGVRGVTFEEKELPRTREAFVAAVGPVIGRRVGELGAGVPVSLNAKRAKWRPSELWCIVHLAAYECWWRRHGGAVEVS